MHKTNSSTKIVLTLEKVIIRGFGARNSKPIPIKWERDMIDGNNDILHLKCFVHDMNIISS
jgi:hypothetical protein